MEGRVDTRRQQPEAALRDPDDRPDAFDQTIDRLVNDGLLVSGSQPGDERTVDLAHDALITGWPRLRDWVAAYRSGELLRRQLEAKASEWTDHGQSERWLLNEAEAARGTNWLDSQDARTLGASARLSRLVSESRATLARTREMETRRRRHLVMLGALLLVTIPALLFAFFHWQRADGFAASLEHLRRAAVHALQANQLHLLDQDETAALLAAESLAASDRGGGTQWGLADKALRDTVEIPFFSRLLEADQSWIDSIAFSQDGAKLAVGSFDGTVQLWNMLDSPPEPFGRPFPATNGLAGALAFDPSGSILVTGGYDGEMKWWDVRNLRVANDDEPPRLSSHVIPAEFDREVRAIAFSPRGDLLVAAGDNGFISLWDVGASAAPTFSELRRLVPPACPDADAQQATPRPCLAGDNVLSLAFNHDGTLLAAAGDQGVIWVWELSGSAQPLFTLAYNPTRIFTVAFHPARDLVAAGGESVAIALWDLANRDVPCVVWHGHDEVVRSLDFSQFGETLASGSEDQTVRLWDVERLPAAPTCKDRTSPIDEGALTVLGGSEDYVRAVAISPNDLTLASASSGGRVRLWDLGELGAGRQAGAQRSCGAGDVARV